MRNVFCRAIVWAIGAFALVPVVADPPSVMAEDVVTILSSPVEDYAVARSGKSFLRDRPGLTSRVACSRSSVSMGSGRGPSCSRSSESMPPGTQQIGK